MSTKRIAPGITRFDIEERRTHGYMVRMARQGIRHQKFFSDLKYGGKAKALGSARKLYEQWTKELPQRVSAEDRLTDRNRTGRVGVYLAVSRESGGQSYDAYCASWTDDRGRRHKISFSLQRYGKRKAWQLACLARDERVANRSIIVKLLEGKTSNKKTRHRK
jgi:hypothetical protein